MYGFNCHMSAISLELFLYEGGGGGAGGLNKYAEKLHTSLSNLLNYITFS